MKPFAAIVSALFIAFAASTTYAEKFSLSREIAPFDSIELNGGIWNASLHAAIYDRSRVNAEISGAGMFSVHLPDHCMSYKLIADTLIFRGVNYGRNIGYTVTTGRERILQFPLSSSSALAGKCCLEEFEHQGPAANLKDTYESQVVRHGRFVASPGDTVPAYLVRESHTFSPEYEAEGPETEASTYVYYRWYTPGARLPFAVQTDVYDNIGRQPASSLYMMSHIEYTPSDNEEDEEARRKQVIDNTAVSRNGADISVCLGRLAGECAEINLADIRGYTCGQYRLPLDNDTNTIEIDTSHLQHGNYIVTVRLESNPTLFTKILVSV